MAGFTDASPHAAQTGGSYVDDIEPPREYRLFHRLEDGRYLLAVVKIAATGAFFASMYPTGRRIRASHRHFRRLR